ncbi:AmmeMemoRadiSam system protein B [Candidatus Gracilibacteria bacterium]|nr:AmmeMemoRadiSam system protein B [Candidatus Gracilibacteria bacterium]
MAKLLKIIGTSAAILAALSSCSPQTPKAAIIPHHLFVESIIDEMYQKIPATDKIVLLSPNHFGYGINYIQTKNIEPDNMQKEHGITIHLDFIEKYFPDAEILPITIKQGTPEEKLDELITRLPKDAFIIASVDFSHLMPEDKSYSHDLQTLKYLETPKNKTLKALTDLADTGNPDTTAIDSPESLYVLLKSLNYPKFQLYRRTSSLSLSKLTDPKDNTSHLFGLFY